MGVNQVFKNEGSKNKKKNRGIKKLAPVDAPTREMPLFYTTIFCLQRYI